MLASGLSPLSALMAAAGQWMATAPSRPIERQRYHIKSTSSQRSLEQKCSLAQKHFLASPCLLPPSTELHPGQLFHCSLTPAADHQRPFFLLRPAGTSSGPNASRCPPSMAPFFPKSREQSLPSPSVQTLPGSSRSMTRIINTPDAAPAAEKSLPSGNDGGTEGR